MENKSYPEPYNGSWRGGKFASGEAELRSHLPDHVPLKLSLVWQHDRARWEVKTIIHPAGHDAIELLREPLETFPSVELIAEAMLLAQ